MRLCAHVKLAHKPVLRCGSNLWSRAKSGRKCGYRGRRRQPRWWWLGFTDLNMQTVANVTVAIRPQTSAVVKIFGRTRLYSSKTGREGCGGTGRTLAGMSSQRVLSCLLYLRRPASHVQNLALSGDRAGSVVPYAGRRRLSQTSDTAAEGRSRPFLMMPTCTSRGFAGRGPRPDMGEQSPRPCPAGFLLGPGVHLWLRLRPLLFHPDTALGRHRALGMKPSPYGLVDHGLFSSPREGSRSSPQVSKMHFSLLSSLQASTYQQSLSPANRTPRAHDMKTARRRGSRSGAGLRRSMMPNRTSYTPVDRPVSLFSVEEMAAWLQWAR